MSLVKFPAETISDIGFLENLEKPRKLGKTIENKTLKKKNFPQCFPRSTFAIAWTKMKFCLRQKDFFSVLDLSLNKLQDLQLQWFKSGISAP